MASKLIIWINDYINESMVSYLQDYFVFKNPNGQDIELIINTKKGEISQAEKIVNILSIYKKENPENKIRAHIYKDATGVATYLALCADELYMSKYAYLGELEPSNYYSTEHNMYRMTQKNHAIIEKIEGISEDLILNKIELETELKYMKEKLKEKLNENPKYKKNAQKIINLFINKPFKPDEIFNKYVLEDNGLTIENIPEELMVLIENNTNITIFIGTYDDLKNRSKMQDYEIFKECIYDNISEEYEDIHEDIEINNIPEYIEETNMVNELTTQAEPHYNSKIIEEVNENIEEESNNIYKYFYFGTVILGSIMIAGLKWLPKKIE